jgi:O-antigen ligase
VSVALAPSTLSLIGDMFGRGYSESSGYVWSIESGEVVRLVAVLLVATVLVVAGVRGGLLGLVVPGIVALVLVIGSQIIDVARLIPAWIVLAIVGIALLIAGARWEWVLRSGRRAGRWVGDLR